MKTERLATFLVALLSVALMCCGLPTEAQATLFSEVASSVSPNTVDQWWYYGFSLQVRNDSAGELTLTTATTFRMQVDATHYFQVPLSHETVVAAGAVATLEFGRDRVCGCLTAGPYNPTLSLAGHDAGLNPFNEVMVTTSNPVTINYFYNASPNTIGGGPSTKSFTLPPAGTVIGPFTITSVGQTVPWGIKAEAGPSDYLEILSASNPPYYGDTYLEAPLSPEVPLPEIITELAPDERLPYYVWVRPKAGATLEAGQTYTIMLYVKLMRPLCPHDGGVIIGVGVGLRLEATYDLTPLHTVSFSQAGPGSGHVDINGYGWSLPFSRLFFDGTSLTVTPRADTGSRFDHWEGDLTGVANPITFTVSGDVSAAPYFALRTYTLSLAGSHGTVKVDDVEHSLPWSGAFSYGSQVSLEALPAPECQFQRWSGAISTTENPTSITITGDMTVTAEFVVPPLPTPFADDFSTNRPWAYAGHWERGPAVSGGGDPGSDHSASGDNYLLGYRIGGQYDYWMSEQPVTSPPVDCSSAAHVALSFWRWLRLADAGDHAYVRVSTDGVTWSDVWSDGGAATKDSAWTYCEYDITSLAAAQPSVWVRFVMGPTNNVMLDGGWSVDDFSLRAQNTLSVSGTGGTVRVNSVSHALPWSGLVDHGAVVTLEAVPDIGYLFANWSGDLTGSTNPDSISIDGDKSVTVSFIAHVFSVTANPPSPSTVASAGSASLSAGFSDTGGHGVSTWSWDDGGGGGSFSPSASAQNPTYTAAANTTDGDRIVTLTVSGTCSGPSPLGDSDSTSLTVQPVAHTLDVHASADPAEVESGESSSLSASYSDSRTHTITSWSWSDGGAGGSFWPSASVQNPTYIAPENPGESDLIVTLTVNAQCDGPSPLGDSDSTSLTVQPAVHGLWVTAAEPSPSTVASGGTTDLSASAVDSRTHSVATWSWSDGSAGGHFSPSALVQSPSYTARANATRSTLTVHLTVTGTCDGPSPLEDSDTVDLTVLPIPPGVHSIGLYDGASSTFYLRNANSAGPANLTVRFGPSGAGWAPIGGDYDADGDDTIGLYNQTAATFYLRNANAPGPADLTFRFGPAPNNWIPIAGDWDGDGDSTFGLYNAATGTFYLRNSNNPGPADLTFRFGPSSSTWLPIAGDWDGNGTDTIGLYDPTNGTFYLRNTNSAGAANLTFRFGPKPSTWKPIAGDWNQDGTETIGLYDPANGTYYLRDANSAGAANLTFRFGPKPSTWKPIAGDWDGQ